LGSRGLGKKTKSHLDGQGPRVGFHPKQDFWDVALPNVGSLRPRFLLSLGFALRIFIFIFLRFFFSFQ